MNEVAFQTEDAFLTNILVNGQKTGSIVKAFGSAQVCLLGKNVINYKGLGAEQYAREWALKVLSSINAKECLNRLDEPTITPHQLQFETDISMART